MKICVISSCTASKAMTHPKQLTMRDFRQGEEWRRNRELDLPVRQAKNMYTGPQHFHIDRGISRFTHETGEMLDWYILSAGYGLIRPWTEIAPYNATFHELPLAERDEWIFSLRIAEKIQTLLSHTDEYDLVLVALGDEYMAAGRFNQASFEIPTLFLTSRDRARILNTRPNAFAMAINPTHARYYHLPWTAVKGRIIYEILSQIAYHPERRQDPRGLLDRIIQECKEATPAGV